MPVYLGDFAFNQTIDFKWNTADSNGASITRATNGTISVYKNNSVTQTTTGVTDTEDFDTLTGVHHCRIVTTDAFYVANEDYQVVLSAATIDGQTVNAVIAHFSIENRADSKLFVRSDCTTGSSTTVVKHNLAEATTGHYNGRVILFTSGALTGGAYVINGYTSTDITVSTMTDTPASGDDFVII